MFHLQVDDNVKFAFDSESVILILSSAGWFNEMWSNEGEIDGKVG